MKNQRNVPRYEVIHLKPTLTFPVLDSTRFFIKDLSLGGLQLYCTSRISLKSFNQVTFKLGNQPEINLNVHQVWGEENPVIKDKFREILKEDADRVIYRTGLRLKFFNKEEYNSWVKILLAIHKIQEKKSN